MQPIRILTPALALLGEVDNYLSFVFSRSYHQPGEFQLVTNQRVQNADQLKINNLVMVGADSFKTGIIRHRELKTRENGAEILTVKGYSLGVITKQRITIPPAGEAYDTILADAETVMKHLVAQNCLNIPGMEFPFLSIAANRQRGEVLKWQSRYKNLEEELENLSKLSGLGWHIYPDFTAGKWIFEVYAGRDLSASQKDRPPVIFSPEFDNVRSQEFIDSLADFGNFALVAGQGQGAEREIALTGSDALGFDRHVIFVDARDLEDADDLPGRGEAKLAEHQRALS